MPNKPMQATSGTQEKPRFNRSRPCRSRLMGKTLGITTMDYLILLLWLLIKLLEAAKAAEQQSMEGFVALGAQVGTSLVEALIPRLLWFLFLVLLLSGGLLALVVRARRDAQQGHAVARPQAAAG